MLPRLPGWHFATVDAGPLKDAAGAHCQVLIYKKK